MDFWANAKKKTALLLAVLLAACLLCACGDKDGSGAPPVAASGDSAASAVADVPDPAEPLFVPEVGDSIMLGAAALQNGEDAKLQAEIGVTGPTAFFTISREKPSGTKMMAVAGSAGQDFIGDFTLPGIVDEYGDLAPGYAVQLSTFDLDADGTLELAASVGDGATVMQTVVYRYMGGAVPFEIIGTLDGQAKMTQKGKKIKAPNTDEALSAQYRYKDGALQKVVPKAA